MSQKPRMDTMLRIRVNNPVEFARKYWDTYGFDYDMERARKGQLWAWPVDCTLAELEKNLAEDSISFSRAEVDLDVFFALERLT